jgi:hypothetical protein
VRRKVETNGLHHHHHHPLPSISIETGTKKPLKVSTYAGPSVPGSGNTNTLVLIEGNPTSFE